MVGGVWGSRWCSPTGVRVTLSAASLAWLAGSVLCTEKLCAQPEQVLLFGKLGNLLAGEGLVPGEDEGPDPQISIKPAGAHQALLRYLMRRPASS